MAEIRWSKLAVRDLKDIIVYISLDSEENAKLFVQELLILLKLWLYSHTQVRLYPR